MGYPDVKVTHQSDEFPTRRTILKAGNKVTTSPRRTLCLTKDVWSEARTINKNNLPGIVEVPRHFDPERLHRIDGNADRQDEFSSDISNLLAKVNYEQELVMFVFTYDNRKDGKGTKPTLAETKYLANLLSSPQNDLVLPPLVPGLSTEDYVAFLVTFYEELQSYRSAGRAVGLIPKASGPEFQRITKLYSDRGFRFFAMDLKGKHPIASYVRVNDSLAFLTKLERESGESCFFHALNVPNLRALAKVDVAPAKDMTAFQMGFDGFGSTHVKFKGFIKELADYDPTRNLRAFNRQDYGYYKLEHPGLEKSLAEEWDTNFPVNEMMAAKGLQKRKLTKLFNIERQGLEANATQLNTIEGTLTKYFESKTQVSDYLPRFKKLAEQRE